MTQDEISEFLQRLGNVKRLVACQENGDPEISWGDTFFYAVDAAGESPKMPFATMVIKDYTGFDELSKLNRGGLYRVNTDIGKNRFNELFGYFPADHESHSSRFDYTALDTFFPHPLYATYGWASVINPSAASRGQLQEILVGAHSRALRKLDVA